MKDDKRGELKACPFCGGPTEDLDNSTSKWVGHKKGCFIGSIKTITIEKLPIWNTRPDVSAIPDSDIITGLKQERGSLRHRVEKLRGQRDKAEDKLLDDSAVVEALRELVEAEWMVSHDYGGGRDGLITKIETVLAAHDKRQQAERGEG